MHSIQHADHGTPAVAADAAPEGAEAVAEEILAAAGEDSPVETAAERTETEETNA